MKFHVENPPQFTRFERSQIAESFQYKDGGKYGVGMIENVSVITRGEALGHDAWIDEPFLKQVAEAINKSENGIKARFTHPSMSSDGLGKLLGRVTNASVQGNKVIGDLHFATSATKSPDGDLVEYVRLLVDEDADAAGLSIVFEHDVDAENEFHLSNGAERIADSIYEPDEIDMSGFKSPDELNQYNLPHVRLDKLRAADLVDEPAANPDGIYSLQTLPNDADSFLRFVVGEAKQKPNALFGVDAQRASEFFQRWLRANDYVLAKGETMEPETKATENVDDDSVDLCETCGAELKFAEESDNENEASDDVANEVEGDSSEQPDGDAEAKPEGDAEGDSEENELSDDEKKEMKVSEHSQSFSKADFFNQLKKYTENFGAINGQEWFENGVPLVEAFERHSKLLSDENESLTGRVHELETMLKSIEFGESEGLGIGASDESIRKPMTFAQFTKSQTN